MKKMFALVTMGIFLSGCASIIDGKTQLITVNSNVEGADVSVVNVDKNETIVLGKTPFTGLVQKFSKSKLVVSKTGFKSAEIILNSETNLVFLGNILCFGTSIFGTSTDFSTGAIYKYSQNSYLANLEPAKAADTERFKKESAVRMFAIYNYDRIMTDVAIGKGEYLNSLAALLGAKSESDKNSKVSMIKEAQKNAASIPDFAAQIVSRM